MIRLLLAWTVAFFVAVPEPQVTPEDVVAMMAAVPARGSDQPGHYERARDAGRIAIGIAAAVNEETETVLGDRRLDAVLLVVFASYESGLRANAMGDGGQARGPWQLHEARSGVAMDPARGAREWLYRARIAMRTCVESPPEERLALLASGRCTRARRLSRERVEIARAIAGGVSP